MLFSFHEFRIAGQLSYSMTPPASAAYLQFKWVTHKVQQNKRRLHWAVSRSSCLGVDETRPWWWFHGGTTKPLSKIWALHFLTICFIFYGRFFKVSMMVWSNFEANVCYLMHWFKMVIKCWQVSWHFIVKFTHKLVSIIKIRPLNSVLVCIWMQVASKTF